MSVTRPLGFAAAATSAGIKPSGKPDMCLIVCEDADARAGPGRGGRTPIHPRRSAAAVFTSNAVVGAPIEIGRRWRDGLGGGGLCAVLVNSGNANAATGRRGVEDAEACMRAVAECLGCRPEEVLPSSTGIIGRPLPVERMTAAVPGLAGALSRGEGADRAAAEAIMTTDLVPKSAHREVELFGHTVHLGAIAKGSGMIAPRLDSAPQGTMLAFLTTDAAVGRGALRAALEYACRESFDRISVDAHPSCSDTAVLMASGMAGGDDPAPPIMTDMPEYHAFRGALTSLCEELAEKIVRDGEGATRVFRVEVRSAASRGDAERIARAVVDSPLVKCAVHGKDPNWGRIVTAAGNAGVGFDPERTSLTIGGVVVYERGVPTEFDKSDPRLRSAMEGERVEMVLDIGEGEAGAWMLGCDLSAEYVRINADYTT